MALYIIKWFYAWLLPVGGLVLLLIFLSAYQLRRRSKGRWALVAVTVLFYALSVDPMAYNLIHPLEWAYEQPVKEALDGDVIVLLGGGARADVPDFDGEGQVGEAAANRFLTTVRLYHEKHVPIILSGGPVLPGDADEAAIEKRMLLSLGVPESDIYMDEKSRNTAENAANTRALCEIHGWQRPIVVTSAFHMKRAFYFFTREGLDGIAYPCDYRFSRNRQLNAFSFIPQSYDLFTSCLAIKEYIGILAASLHMQ